MSQQVNVRVGTELRVGTAPARSAAVPGGEMRASAATRDASRVVA